MTNTDPNDRDNRYGRGGTDATSWVIGVIVAVFIAGLLTWSISEKIRTAHMSSQMTERQYSHPSSAGGAD
jgi:hypothetical protein